MTQQDALPRHRFCFERRVEIGGQLLIDSLRTTLAIHLCGTTAQYNQNYLVVQMD